MKVLQSILNNKCNISIIIICGLKVRMNEDRYQRNQKWHSVDIKAADESLAGNRFLNHAINFYYNYILQIDD